MVQSVDYNAITINDRMEIKMKNLLTIKNINDLSNTQIVDAMFGAIQDGVLNVGFESAEDYCVIADDAKSANIIETCTIDCKKEDCAQFLKSFDETLAKLSQVKTDKITGTLQTYRTRRTANSHSQRADFFAYLFVLERIHAA